MKYIHALKKINFVKFLVMVYFELTSLDHFEQAQQIALNAKRFAFDNLLPEHLYCYHAVYFLVSNVWTF